jgi:hypothetical protein
MLKQFFKRNSVMGIQCIQSAGIRQTLKTILNTNLTDTVWKHRRHYPCQEVASVVGIRTALDLALPAFLSSINRASELTQNLLPNRMRHSLGILDSLYITAQLEWQTRCSTAVPDATRSSDQKAWDAPLVSQKLEIEVMSNAQTPARRARLIAAAALHSGDFLQAVPCSSLGMRLDDTALYIAVSLHLGATMCAPHTCVCGDQVDSFEKHGLVCRKSAGLIFMKIVKIEIAIFLIHYLQTMLGDVVLITKALASRYKQHLNKAYAMLATMGGVYQGPGGATPS